MVSTNEINKIKQYDFVGKCGCIIYVSCGCVIYFLFCSSLFV